MVHCVVLMLMRKCSQHCLQEKEVKYRLALDGLKLRDVDSGFLSRSIKFALFSTESRCIYCSVGWIGSLVVRALDLQVDGVCVRPSECQQNCAACEPCLAH